LLSIPWAAIGTAQAGHDAHGFGEKGCRIGGRVALRAHSNNVNDRPEDYALGLRFGLGQAKESLRKP